MNNIQKLFFCFSLFCLTTISCQKTDSVKPAENVSAKENDVQLVNETMQNMTTVIPHDDFYDLDWKHALTNNTGNAKMIIVKSKTNPAKTLLYQSGNLKMYVWKDEVHFIAN